MAKIFKNKTGNAGRRWSLALFWHRRLRAAGPELANIVIFFCTREIFHFLHRLQEKNTPARKKNKQERKATAGPSSWPRFPCIVRAVRPTTPSASWSSATRARTGSTEGSNLHYSDHFHFEGILMWPLTWEPNFASLPGCRLIPALPELEGFFRCFILYGSCYLLFLFPITPYLSVFNILWNIYYQIDLGS